MIDFLYRNREIIVVVLLTVWADRLGRRAIKAYRQWGFLRSFKQHKIEIFTPDKLEQMEPV